MQVTLLNSVNEAASSTILSHETALRKTPDKPYVNHVCKYFREMRAPMQAALDRPRRRQPYAANGSVAQKISLPR